jgi:hypothetical protein
MLIVNEIKKIYKNDNFQALGAVKQIILNNNLTFTGNKNNPLKDLQEFLQDK